MCDMLIVVWSLIEATTNQLARMLMGYLVDHCIVYCLMEKVFRFIYLKNMGRVCGGIWLASCRRSVCRWLIYRSKQSMVWLGSRVGLVANNWREGDDMRSSLSKSSLYGS